MTHLSDNLLFEYLDHELLPKARAEVETHLEACANCANRLSELQALFSTLEKLPDLPLNHDLTPGVMSSLPGRENLAPALWWAAAMQAVLAVIVFITAAPLHEYSRFARGALDTLQQANARIIAELQFIPKTWEAVQNLPVQFASALEATLTLQLPLNPVLWGLALTALMWLAGNALLLPRERRLPKR